MKPFSRLEVVLVVVLALFMGWVAIRSFVSPGPAATGFGIPIVDPSDLFYLRIKADRDLASVLVMFALLAFRERRALGIFIAIATVQPLCDLILSLSDPRGHAAFAFSVHGSATVYCVITALLLLRTRTAESR